MNTKLFYGTVLAGLIVAGSWAPSLLFAGKGAQPASQAESLCFDSSVVAQGGWSAEMFVALSPTVSADNKLVRVLSIRVAFESPEGSRGPKLYGTQLVNLNESEVQASKGTVGAHAFAAVVKPVTGKTWAAVKEVEDLEVFCSVVQD